MKIASSREIVKEVNNILQYYDRQFMSNIVSGERISGRTLELAVKFHSS